MSSINNLNIFTFIKDIYQSLKHIDQYFSNFNTNINSRINKLEDNQQIIIDKMNNIEHLLNKISDVNKENEKINKNIENELLEKIQVMNTINKTSGRYRVELKPEELTFSNILENNYSLQDINTSLDNNSSILLQDEINTNIFNSSSGSSYYSNFNSSSSSSSSNESIDISYSKISKNIEKLNNIENLNSLLF